MAPDGADLLLDMDSNISQSSHLHFPLLVSWASPFEENLEWLQFAYTADSTGAYLLPTSTVLVLSAVS